MLKYNTGCLTVIILSFSLLSACLIIPTSVLPKSLVLGTPAVTNNMTNGTEVYIVPLNEEQREIRIDPTMLERLISNASLGSSSNRLNLTSCNTIDGTSSSSLGINEQTPCTVSLSNNDKEINIDFDYEIIENDDTNSIIEYYNNLQEPNNVILNPGEVFMFSRNGGENYDQLDIYLVDQTHDNGNIVGIDSSNIARVFLDHFKFNNIDFFMVPEFDDGLSAWKLVVGYENNDELVSFFIADNITIEE
jgi:hypothetical protein